MRYLSVCSGMEAASVAWHPLGWQPVGFSEIEPFPCAILKHRFPNVPNYGSLTEYQSWPLEPGSIDLLVGGTPCQSFSVAGLRKGLEDPRGNLALVFLGLADKLKPRWIVWENVPGVLSSNSGRDFGSFLGALVELGYGFAYRVLDAQYFGVPQRRRRVFVVACLGDWHAAAEVLLESDCVRRDPKKGRAKGQSVAAGVEGGVGADLPIWRAGDQANAEHMIDHAGAISCNKGSHGGFIAKPLTYDMKQHHNPQAVSHWEGGDIHPTLNQAHNIGSPGYSNQELFSQKGAGLVPTAIPYRKSKRACSTTDNETWVPADDSNTLNNFDLGDTRTKHAVINNVAPTVTSSGPPYSRTGNERVEAEALAVTFQPGNLRRDAGADPSTTTTTIHKASAGDQMPHIEETEVMDSLVARGPHAVGQPIPINTMAALRPEGSNQNRQTFGIGQAGDPQFTISASHCHAVAFDGYNQTLSNTSQTIRADKSDGDHVGMVLQPMAVRRLTPVECERLQGFPDNWSRISWKGKPEEDCPDGPRYKACGNSMAVPCMFWIGNRIAEYEAKA